MPFSGDDRGQSVVIGAVILFGFLVIALSTYQATVVPQQNSQVEFAHEQTVRDDFVGVRDAVVTTGTTGETTPASVKLGTRFPGRTLFINPPPAVGRIETGEPRNVTLNVSNANFSTDVPEESAETEEGWPTAATTDGNYTSRPLVYTPQYRSYDGGPRNVTLELSHVVATYAGGERLSLTQTPLLVSGDRVTLFLLKGNLSEAGTEAVTLEPSAVSPVSDRQLVSNFNVTVPTSLTANQFETVLTRGTAVDSGDVIVTENTSRRAVDVRFPDEYGLAVAAVSVGRHDERRTASAVDFVSAEQRVTQGESARVVVRVRDQYGNTLPGATVFANSSDIHDAGERRVTGDRGRAAFELNTSRITGNTNPRFEVAVNVTVNRSVADELNGSSSSFEQTDRENATVNVTVESASAGPGLGPAPGSGNASVRWNQSAMDAVAGLDYFPGNRTLLINRSQVGTEFTARANATNTSDGSPLSGVELDFASNNASIVGFDTTGSNEPGPTNSAGELSSPAEVSVEGTTTISVFGAGASDELKVKTVGSPGASRPSGRAFDDADGDGVYDAGETTYTAAELEDGFDDSLVNLVIPSDVGPLNSGGNQLQISVNSLTSRVDIDTGGGQLQLRASGGDIDVSGGSQVSSGGSQMQLTAFSGAIRFNGSTLDSGGDQIQLTGEGIYGTNAAVQSGGSETQMDGGASNVVLTGTLVDSNGGQIDISTDATLRIADTTVNSGGSEASLSGGDVFGDDVTVDTNGDALRITATSGGNIRTRGGVFRTNGGEFDMVTNGGDICLNPSPTRSSEIRAGGGEATISTADTSYLHDLFVSASGQGLRYGGSGRGDYYGTVDPNGDGLRDGPGRGNDDWDQIDGSRTDCGF